MSQSSRQSPNHPPDCHDVRVLDARRFTKELPLKSPYKLSFGTVTSFESCFVEIALENGSSGVGEATALPGYADETSRVIAERLADVCAQLPGRAIDQARLIVDELYSEFPFSASAVGTALDEAVGAWSVPERLRVPLVHPVAASRDIREMLENVESAVRHGYRTVKVKVANDADADPTAARALLQASFGVSYRFDANQGYTPDEARQLLEAIVEAGPTDVEYLEQPFPVEDWGLTERLCKEYPGRIMLDESIYDQADIRRASDCGAEFIKLKLFKAKGVSHLLAVTRYTRELGLKVVLGNGVATDVCNLAEAAAFTSEDGLYHGAFEGNGFLKMAKCLRHDALREKSGMLVYPCPPDA